MTELSSILLGIAFILRMVLRMVTHMREERERRERLHRTYDAFVDAMTKEKSE